MNYVVLVKQVPDTGRIPRDAWDWETGTLRRALLENVCNELDKQAMAFALDLRGQKPGKIVALTMGPPFAEEVLRYALSLGADRGVLLTDRRLGGADTPATAYPLAQAIRRIEKEIFGGNRDYTIITGVQSVDGDTAQVPPQVAEDMGIDHVSYVTGFSFDEQGGLTLRRVTSSGNEAVAVERFPFLATMTEWTLPPYPAFQRTRWAAASEIDRWDADAVGADKARIGLAGSRTGVVKIFPVREATKRPCVLLSDLTELVERLKAIYGAPENGDSADGNEESAYRLPEGKTPEYRGEFWVFAEHDGKTLHPASFELLGKAREMAVPMGESVGAILTAPQNEEMAAELIAHGADKIYVVEHERLSQFVAVPYSRALTELIGKFAPQALLFSATPLGRELAPRVAYATESGLTADCTDIRLGDLKRGKKERVGIMIQTRPALGGNIMASIVSQNSRVQMSTARPGVLKALPADRSRTGEIVRFRPQLNGAETGVRVLSVETGPQGDALAGAPIVVAGGIGCRTREGFEQNVGALATSLGNYFHARALTGASRQAVEAGFVDRACQVGQTGQTISPDLYVALGISGAVQHLTGVRGAKIVVAINKDANAPIFRDCDFGVVGRLETVVPELVRLLEGSDGGKNS